jgi:hypothetical protein
MPAATCKYCKRSIRWAALEGRTLPFEPCPSTEARAVAIGTAHGTDRARPHPSGYPNVPSYRRHQCERKR